MVSEPRLIWDLQAELGEGPVWVSGDSALWFTDIKRRAVYRFDPATGGRQSWAAPEEVGFVLPRRSGGFIAGLKSGLFAFGPASGEFSRIVDIEPDKPSNRLNDGTLDPSGRLWFGTMDNGEGEASGAFYVFDQGQVSETAIGGICITNGPAVSPDGRMLYVVDTLKRTLSACDVREDASLGPPRELVRIAKEDGHPDGPTVDSEGCIWVGLYGGWEARRYSPSGELLDRVGFPVGNITKIALGGPELRTAFATTARQKLGAEELERQPLAGGLFEFDVDVPGVQCPLLAD